MRGAAATRRAVRDVLARGLSTEHSSARAVELGQHLQSGVTADMSDGATPAEVLAALQEEAVSWACTPR